MSEKQGTILPQSAIEHSSVDLAPRASLMCIDFLLNPTPPSNSVQPFTSMSASMATTGSELHPNQDNKQENDENEEDEEDEDDSEMEEEAEVDEAVPGPTTNISAGKIVVRFKNVWDVIQYRLRPHLENLTPHINTEEETRLMMTIEIFERELDRITANYGA